MVGRREKREKEKEKEREGQNRKKRKQKKRVDVFKENVTKLWKMKQTKNPYNSGMTFWTTK